MELKQLYVLFLHGRRVVLIVPYGIETRHNARSDQVNDVLIVPYGIETNVY